MNIQYFKSAWGDVKNSPGWVGKLCLLALLNFIPIFGQIVTLAYLYGWAREIAWGTHEPLPGKIFSNGDGKFWRRGWFALVLTFVFMLIPQIVAQFGNYLQAMAVVHVYSGNVHAVGNPALGMLGGLLVFVGVVGALACSVLSWVGIMRISIYDRLSAGFQLGKIWKMVRHDATGLLKVFGMGILFEVILGFILSIIIVVLIFIVVFAGIAGLVNAGYSPQSISYMTETQAFGMLMQFVMSAGVVGFLAIVAGTFLSLVAVVFIQMLIVRAVGYWTMQFEVPRWGGQDDPLPFETAAPQPQPQQPPAYGHQQPYGGQQPAQQPYAAGTQPAQQPYGAETQPSSQPAQQPAAQVVEQPVGTVAEQPAEQPAQQPTAQPVEQPAAQPVEQPVGTVAEQPVQQSAEQPMEQAAQQPASQPAEKEQLSAQPQSAAEEQPNKSFDAESSSDDPAPSSSEGEGASS